MQITTQKGKNLDPRAKKTRKKMVSQWINEPLIALDSPAKKHYTRAFHCASRLDQEGNKFTSRYCNSRTCLTCNGIRTANYLANYGAQLLQFKDPQFLTLTAPTVEAFDAETLQYYVSSREGVWRKIFKNSIFHKKNLSGVKTMEITARPHDRYHIHFHFIIEGRENAQWIKRQWLNHYADALPFLQVIKPIKSEGALLEVFKYGTKFLNGEQKIVKGKKVETFKRVEPERTDLIIQALYKKRLISAFGSIKKIKDEDVNDMVESVDNLDDTLIEYGIWLWHYDIDWINEETGERFSDFIPNEAQKIIFSR
jgi:hypothetical protein